MSKTGADIMIESLVKNGINTVFWYPWGANMPLYDRLELSKDIRHILVRNEQWAAFAAQWYARTTNKIGVCFATSWPWASNLITGIMDAYMDSIPMLIITGQVPFSVMGSDAFQELDTIGTTMSITKHSFIADDVDKIPAIVDEAIKIAMSGRKGPVLIDFPKDISNNLFKEEKILEKPLYHSNIEKVSLSKEKAQEALEIIKNAKRPLLLIGQWVKFADAEVEVNKFINTMSLPVVSTLLAKWIVSEDNPNYLGMIGMHGFYHANLAAHNADVIINIGSRFDDRLVGTYESFGKWKKIIHIDIDICQLKKLLPTVLAIHSDAKNFLSQIMSFSLEKLAIDEWRNQIENWKKEKPYEVQTTHFSMKNAMNMINAFTKGKRSDFICTTDVWQHQMWAAQIIKVANAKSWLSSWGAGTMGFSLPNSIGAAIANPDKTIINIVWDGSIQMNIQELQVLKEHNLNVKVIILNNSFLGMVRQWQELFFDKNYASTPITSPNYKLLAEAYGIHGYSVKNNEELENVFKEEFSSYGPAVIEVKIEKDEDNIFPMVPPWYSLWETFVCSEEMVCKK